jgi:ABC-2 type transport system permease protein
MRNLGRYLRLYLALARFGLAREFAFRGNFLVKIFVEVLWLGMLLAFYGTVFSKTRMVAGWSRAEYLFFVGCYFALEGMVETLFLENCNEFSDLIRSGDLDFFLLKPIDEQFLVTCRKIDWSTAPNVLMGAGVMIMALAQQPDWSLDTSKVLWFAILFLCGLGMAYGFIVMLTAGAVWFVRNQSLFELWWLFTSLMRYPSEMYVGKWGLRMGRFFTFVVPILLVVSMPASVMVKALDPGMAAFTVVVTVILLYLSRRLFRYALRRYRSASS